MTDISVHEFEIAPQRKAEFINVNRSEMWRVACAPEQARALAEAIDATGWMVWNINRLDAMPLEEAVKKLAGLKIVAMVTKPSPFTIEGELTEEAKADIRAGRMRATDKDGKSIDPAAATEANAKAGT